VKRFASLDRAEVGTDFTLGWAQITRCKASDNVWVRTERRMARGGPRFGKREQEQVREERRRGAGNGGRVTAPFVK